MMDLEQIDLAFEKMIYERGIHNKLEVENHIVKNYRRYLKSGQAISLDLKLKLLNKAGWLQQQPGKEYTRKDLEDLVRFLNKEKVQHEPDYAVHKFLLTRKQ